MWGGRSVRVYGRSGQKRREDLSERGSTRRRLRRHVVAAATVVLAAGLTAASAIPGAAAAGSKSTSAAAVPTEGLPYEDPNLPVSQRVADLLSRMTLEEKVGQMTQTERYQVYDDPTPITTWKLGSILSGGGSTPPQNTPQAWADMVDRFQR